MNRTNALKTSIIITSVIGGYMTYVYPIKIVFRIRDKKYSPNYTILVIGDIIVHQIPLLTILYYNKPLIELTSSISNCPYAEIFYNGFTNAYYHVCREIKTKIIIIENISHNDIMINRIHKTPLEISPTAFFLYNYVSYP